MHPGANSAPLERCLGFLLPAALWRTLPRLGRGVKAAVDSAIWDRRLELRLNDALAVTDSREAWSVSRQLAGHGASRVVTRTAPPAIFIPAGEWEQHMHEVWEAQRHISRR